nr:hypothetical protein [uncultured Ottowia sp.]
MINFSPLICYFWRFGINFAMSAIDFGSANLLILAREFLSLLRPCAIGLQVRKHNHPKSTKHRPIAVADHGFSSIQDFA